MAPIHAGFDRTDPLDPIFIQNTPRTDAPMGPFQAYEGEANSSYTRTYGDIQLNVTHYPLALTGDLNGDGFVGLADLDIVLGHWNATVTAGDLLSGDPSGDGYVGLDDLDTVLGNWNAGTPPAGAVIPEPSTLVVLGFGGLALLRKPRR